MSTIRTLAAPRRLAAGGALALIAPVCAAASPAPPTVAQPAASPIALVAHGGAGTLDREEIGAELESEIRAAMTAALEAGWAILRDGGSSLDAVTATVRALEDSPHFNAGKGAVFTHAGTNELDAAIMDGATGRAGAVAVATRVKNPISAARAVMETTPHVLLVGPAVETLAREAGLELVDPSYFFVQRRWDQLQRELAEQGAGNGASGGVGTVGAVALDRAGRLAAATSTGGRTDKLPGRVGDTPLIGAGTYADAACAVSGTGHGEFFIRGVVAHDICARAAYARVPLADAVREVVHDRLGTLDAEGGVIALGLDGHPILDFNTSGMYRGWIREDGRIHVAIFAD